MLSTALLIFLMKRWYSHWACSQVNIELDYDGGWHTWSGKPRPFTTLAYQCISAKFEVEGGDKAVGNRMGFEWVKT